MAQKSAKLQSLPQLRDVASDQLSAGRVARVEEIDAAIGGKK